MANNKRQTLYTYQYSDGEFLTVNDLKLRGKLTAKDVDATNVNATDMTVGGDVTITGGVIANNLSLSSSYTEYTSGDALLPGVYSFYIQYLSGTVFSQGMLLFDLTHNALNPLCSQIVVLQTGSNETFGGMFRLVASTDSYNKTTLSCQRISVDSAPSIYITTTNLIRSSDTPRVIVKYKLLIDKHT